MLYAYAYCIYAFCAVAIIMVRRNDYGEGVELLGWSRNIMAALAL